MLHPLRPSTRSGLTSHILLAGPDAPMVHQALAGPLSDLHFHICTSFYEVERELLMNPYQTVIANMLLMHEPDSSLITLTQSLHPAVPLIITVNASEASDAAKGLSKGVFGCIKKPVRAPKAVQLIRTALSLYELQVTISQRNQMLASLRQQREVLCSHSSNRNLVHLMDRTVANYAVAVTTCEKSIVAMETSLARLTGVASKLVEETRKQAFLQLLTR